MYKPNAHRSIPLCEFPGGFCRISFVARIHDTILTPTTPSWITFQIKASLTPDPAAGLGIPCTSHQLAKNLVPITHSGSIICWSDSQNSGKCCMYNSDSLLRIRIGTSQRMTRIPGWEPGWVLNVSLCQPPDGLRRQHGCVWLSSREAHSGPAVQSF